MQQKICIISPALCAQKVILYLYKALNEFNYVKNYKGGYFMKKPFIQLFRTPNAKYVLDVNNNEFLQLSDESFAYLVEVMNSTDDSYDAWEDNKNTPQELIELRDAGYLANESVIEEIRHSYSDYLEIFLERKVSKLTLQLTQDCNFRCTYCIYSNEGNDRQRGHSKVKIDWDTAKKAIDFLWEHSADSPSVNIGFYGGEPLLEFPLIEKAVEYSKNLFSGKNLTFSITTNGTLLTDSKILFLEKHDVSLMVSLDGPKQVNDKNRVFVDGAGTFDSVMTQISRIKEIAPNLAKNLQISMVIDPENDFDCINQLCLQGAELEELRVSSSIVEFDYQDKDIYFSKEYSEKSEYQRFLALLAHLNRFPRSHISPITRASVDRLIEECTILFSNTKLRPIDAPSGPCIPGQLRLFVNAFGNFYPCERVSEASPSMIIGNLDDGFDLDKADKILNVGNLTESACKNCWSFRHCYLCAKKADNNENELSAERKLSFCDEVRGNSYSKLNLHLFLNEVGIVYAQQLRAKNGTGGVV